MAVLCIGQLVYDLNLALKEPWEENRKYRIKRHRESPGGPAANAAFLLAKWQLKTTLIAQIGKDLYGEKLLNELEKHAFDLNYLLQSDFTSVSFILNNQTTGTRTIFNEPLAEASAHSFPLLADLKIILLDAHELALSLKALHDYPEASCVLDAGSYNENSKTLAAYADYLVCSADFVRQYCGDLFEPLNPTSYPKLYPVLKQLKAKQIVITLGHNGLLYQTGDTFKHLPAFKVQALDTTGAGDIFHGAFVYGLHEGLSFLDTLNLAQATAALSTLTQGGYASIPSLAAVKAFLETDQLNKR